MLGLLQEAPPSKTLTGQDLVESAEQKQYKSVIREYVYCILKIWAKPYLDIQ